MPIILPFIVFFVLMPTCDCLNPSLIFLHMTVYDILFSTWNVFATFCLRLSFHDIERSFLQTAIATSSLIFRSLRSHNFSFCWFSLALLGEISVVIFFMIFISFERLSRCFIAWNKRLASKNRSDFAAILCGLQCHVQVNRIKSFWKCDNFISRTVSGRSQMSRIV